MRNLIEEDANMSRSAALERYKVESKEEGTSSKTLGNVRKTDLKEEGVAEKLERLKEELLAKIKNQTGAHEV